MRIVAVSRLRRAGLAVVLAAMGMACGEAAVAQQRVPYRERPEPYERYERTYQPGVFDYYLLALSWSPTYCAGISDGRYDPQCHGRQARPYAFVLHGLWPQFEQRWPEFCRGPDNGFVPEPVAQRMLDMMPSKRLVFHEYRKHGACSGLGVDGYFDLARRLYESVKIPERYIGLQDDRLTVSPDELIGEFLAANPKLSRDMIVVECGGPGNRLKEVRICFNKGGGFRACGRNEDQRRLCSAERMYVPPVRVSAQGPDAGRAAPERPSPRQIEQPQSQQKSGSDFLPGPR
jgi:ribonuclease T2